MPWRNSKYQFYSLT